MTDQKSIDCKTIEEQLSAYIDNALDPEEASLVGSHIAHCERCRVIMDELLYMASSLSSIESQPIPTSFDSNLKKALKSRQAVSAWSWSRNRSLGFAAALLMIGIISYSMIGNLSSGNESASTSSMAKSAAAPSPESSLQAPQTYDAAAEDAGAINQTTDADMQVYYELIAEKLTLYEYDIVSTNSEVREITLNVLADTAGNKIDRLLVISYKDDILSIEDNWLNIEF